MTTRATSSPTPTSRGLRRHRPDPGQRAQPHRKLALRPAIHQDHLLRQPHSILSRSDRRAAHAAARRLVLRAGLRLRRARSRSPTPAEVQPWTCRLDPFSTYRSDLRGAHLPALPPRADVPQFPRRPERGSRLPGALHRSRLHHRAARRSDASPSTPTCCRSRRPATCRTAPAATSRIPLPPIDFTYTQAIIDETVRDVDPDSLR